MKDLKKIISKHLPDHSHLDVMESVEQYIHYAYIKIFINEQPDELVMRKLAADLYDYSRDLDVKMELELVKEKDRFEYA